MTRERVPACVWCRRQVCHLCREDLEPGEAPFWLPVGCYGGANEPLQCTCEGTPAAHVKRAQREWDEAARMSPPPEPAAPLPELDAEGLDAWRSARRDLGLPLLRALPVDSPRGR